MSTACYTDDIIVKTPVGRPPTNQEWGCHIVFVCVNDSSIVTDSDICTAGPTRAVDTEKDALLEDGLVVSLPLVCHGV